MLQSRHAEMACFLPGMHGPCIGILRAGQYLPPQVEKAAFHQRHHPLLPCAPKPPQAAYYVAITEVIEQLEQGNAQSPTALKRRVQELLRDGQQSKLQEGDALRGYQRA
jgi:hypothetical protein